MRSSPLFVILSFAAFTQSAFASIPDARFTETPVIASGAGVSQSTGIARVPDGSNRMFIIGKGGAIRVLENGVLDANNWATITPIYTGSECGLIGIAFDPDYSTNHYVYFFVTVSSSEQQIIRYTDVNGRGEDKTVIVPNLPTVGANHDGGGIGFGPDGMLYWSIGDNGSGRGVDGDMSLLASKVGRATPLGDVPADNPFVDGPGGNNDFIYARGFRNPFTLTFEPGRGRLWVNVVGTSYEQVFIVNSGDHAGYNDYENNQPTNYITPVIKYRTNGTDSINIAAAGAVRAGGLVTITTQSTHRFRRGERITLSGIAEPSFNGTVFVNSILTDDSFTAQQPGMDMMSGGGSARTPDFGGCITGGVFYDGTDFPPEFLGNFIFGDYNSDRLMRGIVDANGDLESVDEFGSSFNSIVDSEIGPDGSLYLLGHAGRLVRASYVHSMQSLVVSNTHLRLVEGGRAGFSVRLAVEPPQDVTVTARNSAGDPDVTIETGATLTFTVANWDQPQQVLLFGGLDFDTAEDSATISIESSGLVTVPVEVTVRDSNVQGIAVTTTHIEVPEGSAAKFGVSLTDIPENPITVTVASASPSILIAGGASLTFTSLDFSTPQMVTVAAFEDENGDNETAEITLSSPMVASRTVDVTIRDNDVAAPAFTSTPPTAATVGSTYTYDAEASGLPAATFVLETSPPGVVFDRMTGALTWLPNSGGAFNFTVRATNGVMPDAEQTWTVNAVEDRAPTAMIVKPESNAVLSGTMNDWYGNGTDDVGLVRAEFLVDGTVAYTQTSTQGRYNFMGGANRFDTTSLANGDHVLRLVVYDTAGQSGFAEVTVRVDNQVAQTPDSGTGMPMPMGPNPSGGCSCSTTSTETGAPAFFLIVLVLFSLRRRSGR